MGEHVDWDALLRELPEPHRARFEELLRRSLRRAVAARVARVRTVPESVRSEAVGMWRKRHASDYSKTALRRMNHARLRNDAEYQAIERTIAARYEKRHPPADEASLPDVTTMTFAEVCEAYRSLASAPEGSSHVTVVHELCAQVCGRSVADELRASLTEELCARARTDDLSAATAPPDRHRWRQAPGRGRQRGFTLNGATSPEEVAQRVRECHLARWLLARLLGRPDAASALRDEVLARAKRDSQVKALAQLMSALHGASDALAVTLERQAAKAGDTLLAQLSGPATSRLVAEALLKNPVHGPQYRRAVELKLRVRENVPDTPMDAYPLARTMRRHVVLHVGPTNSGKTHEALRALEAAETGAYLGPLRLLAFEQFERLNGDGCPCTLLTGEERCDVPGARHVSSTVEMADFYTPLQVAVIDEAQMVADPDRGHRWTAAILGIPAEEVHVCCASYAEDVVRELVGLCDDTLEVVRHERLVPLEPQRRVCHVPGDVRPGDALIVFSRKAVHAVAAEVAAVGLRPSLVYGALPHDVRHEEARRFDAGETDVVVATDAIGMGMNLPIRRIVFVEQKKYDGHELRLLHPEEVQQIAGRAGRYGRYGVGQYATTSKVRMMVQRYCTEVPALVSLPVGIPEDIALVRDATLSESIEQWMSLPLPAPFVRMDVSRDLALIRDVERRLDERALRTLATKAKVLALAGMPFDEHDRVLRAAWDRMVDAELAGAEASEAVPAPVTGREALDELEARYRLCDLLYCYARTFRHPAHVEELTRRRTEISHAIMGILARQSAKDGDDPRAAG